MNKYKIVAYLPGEIMCLAQNNNGKLGFIHAYYPEENFSERPEWQLDSAVSKYGYVHASPEVELEYKDIAPYLETLPIPDDE